MALTEKELVKLMAQIHRKYPAGGRRYSTIIEDPYKSGLHADAPRNRAGSTRREAGLEAAWVGRRWIIRIGVEIPPH